MRIGANRNSVTHEELYRMAHAGSQDALKTLITDYRPLLLSESRM